MPDGHPNQGERRAWISRRPPSRRAAYFQKGVRHRSLAGRKMGRGPKFAPDPERLTDVVPPKARDYPPARTAARLGLDERLMRYQGRLTPAQRRRAAHKAGMTPEEVDKYRSNRAALAQQAKVKERGQSDDPAMRSLDGSRRRAGGGRVRRLPRVRSGSGGAPDGG